MFSKINSFGVHGVEGFPVTVEADVSDGLPGFIMVGFLSEAVREAQERVRTALKNAGIHLPPKKVMVNLSPGDIRKEGTAYDLAIAAAVLCCLGEASEAGLEKSAFIGELGLDGCVKPVKGVLPRVFAAAGQGIRRMFVPSDNRAEGTAVLDIEIIGVN
ncbi:MAG: magnesium chelatase domain-containing protein, partial [[Clostridium] symbiosum]